MVKKETTKSSKKGSGPRKYSSPKKKKTSKKTSYKHKYNAADGMRKAGWAAAYSAQRSRISALNLMSGLITSPDTKTHIPINIVNKYTALIAGYDEEKHKCTICDKEMKYANMIATPCGHFFHSECLENRKGDCPECHGKYAKTEQSPTTTTATTSDTDTTKDGSIKIGMMTKSDESEEETEDKPDEDNEAEEKEKYSNVAIENPTPKVNEPISNAVVHQK
jgi:hypothetical protein